MQQAAITVFINCKASQPTCTASLRPTVHNGLRSCTAMTYRTLRGYSHCCRQKRSEWRPAAKIVLMAAGLLPPIRLSFLLLAAQRTFCCRCKPTDCTAVSESWICCCRMRPSSAIFALGGLAGRSMLALFMPTKVTHSKQSTHAWSCSPSSLATMSSLNCFAAFLLPA